jgi:secondary thiamine-phosphate synthase enzyme
METYAPGSTCRHTSIRIATEYPTQFVDLTEQVEVLVAEAGIHTGLVNIQTLHTTTAIVVNEHEPLLLSDFESLFAAVAPLRGAYRHDDASARTVNLAPGERSNGHAHCRALLLGTSVSLNVSDGRLRLGRWQRIFFVELDGPRMREISVLVIGEATR